MIIVNQDKNAIHNFNNVNCIMTRNVEEKCKIMLFDNTYSAEMGDGDCIGTYETEERAKEILQEIIQEYTSSNSSFGYQGYVKNKAYYMPQDKEEDDE